MVCWATLNDRHDWPFDSFFRTGHGFFCLKLASSFYRHQMWLAGHRKMLGLERIRITGGNAKFGTINSHSCSLVFVWGEKGLAPFFLSLHFFYASSRVPRGQWTEGCLYQSVPTLHGHCRAHVGRLGMAIGWGEGWGVWLRHSWWYDEMKMETWLGGGFKLPFIVYFQLCLGRMK